MDRIGHQEAWSFEAFAWCEEGGEYPRQEIECCSEEAWEVGPESPPRKDPQGYEEEVNGYQRHLCI